MALSRRYIPLYAPVNDVSVYPRSVIRPIKLLYVSSYKDRAILLRSSTVEALTIGIPVNKIQMTAKILSSFLVIALWFIRFSPFG